MSRNKLRVGVIGVGYVASNNFLPVFPRFDDVELSGIMANHLESAKKAQRLWGGREVAGSNPVTPIPWQGHGRRSDRCA